jgi:hypothetical protein
MLKQRHFSMTKSFSLSVLVAALPVLAASVPMAVWLAFDTSGRQGVSALPALFLTLVLSLPLLRAHRQNQPLARAKWVILSLLWQAMLWAIALTPSPAHSLTSALAYTLSELLYSAPPALLIGVAGSTATLGLMMSNSPVRGPKD